MADTLVEAVTISQMEEELAAAINSIGGDATDMPITDMPEYIQNNLIAESWDILGSNGITVEKNDSTYTITGDAGITLLNAIGDIPAGTTVQDALETISENIANSTAGIISGSVIRTNADGIDEEYPDVSDLLENSFYIRLLLTDNTVKYLSAYEIDKALAVIAGMSDNKASADDVAALQIALEGKASAAQLALFESDIINKADKETVSDLSAVVDNKADKETVDDLSAVVDSKADKETVSDLSTAVDSKADKEAVDDLSAVVDNKADKQSVDQMKADVIALQEALGSLSDNTTITAIQNQINYLNDEINRRLTIDDLNGFDTDIADISNKTNSNTRRLTDLENNVSNKASVAYVQRHVSELNNAITGLASKFSSKADKTDLAGKASQDDINLLVKRINALSTSTAEDLAELDACCRAVQIELNKKASNTKLDNFITDINTSLATKADKVTVTSSINQLSEKIDAIDLDTPLDNMTTNLHNLETSFNNTLSTMQAVINTHDRKIMQYDSQLSKMQETDSKLEIAASNEWVRVMTPEEYNRLANNPNYSDGTKNPYAKQPNVIYMLVRYNKPIAVYIGTVLIAEAKQDGSVGFAYEFPIIF